VSKFEAAATTSAGASSGRLQGHHLACRWLLGASAMRKATASRSPGSGSPS
jgi:hypothetical protein